MRLDKTESPPQSADDHVAQALDRLGGLVAPVADENEFVSRVMRQIGDAPTAPRRSYSARLLARLAIISAACVIAALVFWRTGVAHRPAHGLVDHNVQRVDVQSAAPPVEPEPAVRTSTWSTVTERVVLENDVPVRKLFYREFERVELVDADGKTEGQMVVPTKAMLVASRELY